MIVTIKFSFHNSYGTIFEFLNKLTRVSRFHVNNQNVNNQKFLNSYGT